MMSVMNPGASSRAPPTMIIAPSKVSAAGTRPCVSARLKRSQAARPCERASAAPANPSRISSARVGHQADRPGDLDDHVELRDRQDQEQEQEHDCHRG